MKRNVEMNSDEIVSLCRELAQKFAARAAGYDRDGAFPVENFQDLKAAGMLGVVVPKQFGGMGADFFTYTRALEQLAMGDASTALAFNMHNIVVGGISEMPIELVEGRRGKAMSDFRQWIFNQVVEHRSLFSAAASEPGVGSHHSKVKTRYKHVPGGYQIDGIKSFVSLCGHCDYYLILARSERDLGDLPALSYLVVDRDNPGLRIDEVWDTMGMRATSSNTLHLEQVFVPSDRLFLGIEGLAIFKSLREPHWFIAAYNGVYLGIANAIFEFLRDYVMKKNIAGSDQPLARDPLVQHRVGELKVALEAARAVTYDAARLVTEAAGTDEANVAIHRAKYMVSELGPWMASHAIRLCGGSTIMRRFPLERYYRDSRCGGVMPARSDDCLSYVGKAMLGVDVRSLEQSYW